MKIKYKLLISLALFIAVLVVSKVVLADEIQGNLGGGLQSGLTGSVTNCSPLTVSNGSVAAYPSCAITCNAGYTLNGSDCIVQSSGGGGGGGSTATYCSSVTYSDWNAACFGTVQNRSVVSSNPSGCILTTTQQLAVQRTCQVIPVTPVTQPIASSELPATLIDDVLANIVTESKIVSTNNTETLLMHLNNSANLTGEQNGLTKFKTILSLDKNISADEKLTINDFIVYGTRGTQRLGAGERAAVVNSYYQAYRKLPNTEAEWSDVLKIANGRWPSERSTAAETQAKREFKLVYARNAVMTNNIDENAIMVIAYGLLPLQRNLNSEKVAIKTFFWVYDHNPVSALAWNVVRAIAYSGATR
jgi:hypothetical protein